MTPETVEISFPVRKAKDLAPFTLEDGTRHLGYHYFQLAQDGTWLFRWIEPSTDPEALIQQIEDGLIYIFD